MTRYFQIFTLSLCATLTTKLAYAWPTGIWATQMTEAASPIKERLHHFNMQLQWIMIAICAVVGVALLYTIIRFAKKRNPVPSKTTHHVALEVVWTLIPCFILAYIMFFSFPLMYYMEKTERPDMTLKVVGYQWYWGYSYPDQEIEEYSTYMIPEPQNDPKNEYTAMREAPTYQRLLSTYELGSGKEGFVVLPVHKNIRVQMTGNDVLHAWAVPALGVKKDAVPGRLNETWLKIDKPGIYYGQCSELCGTLHGFMPIEVRAVEEPVFNEWVSRMKKDPADAFAFVNAQTTQYARAKIHAPHLTLRNLWELIKDGKMTETPAPRHDQNLLAFGSSAEAKQNLGNIEEQSAKEQKEVEQNVKEFHEDNAAHDEKPHDAPMPADNAEKLDAQDKDEGQE